MKVEIWSDVVCPFCYIGKRKFEQALEHFPQRDSVEIEWKSFQLNRDLETNPAINIHQYLAEHKGISLEQAKALNERVATMAREVGLQYHFDNVIVANSFDAHRMLHLAKKHHKQDAMEERLFKAYFIEGKNTADHNILIQLAVEVGLNEHEVRTSLKNNNFAEDVEQDLYEAQQIGVNGVPFFVFANKYAVTGAQPVEVFIEVLNKVSK